MALSIRLRAEHAAMIQAALNRQEVGDDHALSAHIVRALKGRVASDNFTNIRPAMRIVKDRDGAEREKEIPGYPHRSWAYKDDVVVALGKPYAEKVESALKDAAKAKVRGEDGHEVPLISRAQADTLDDLLSLAIPAWKNGDEIKNAAAPLSLDDRELGIIARSDKPLADIPVVDYGGRVAEAVKSNGGTTNEA